MSYHSAAGPPARPKDWAWPLWFLLPLYPYNRRRTLRREVVPGTVWTFDQAQGILYAIVPVRMTVVRLAAGGLLVYAPIAPTPECLRWVRQLEAEHGPVRYVVLPTTSGLEHKVFVGPFARQFKTARVYIAPGQWSFPVNLPLPWLGFPADRTEELPVDSRQAPFADDFDYAVLNIDLGRGSFSEVALLHRRSRTLLVTDTLLSVPAAPPEILQLDPYPLLFHAREQAQDAIADTPENRIKGWQRIALFAIFFQPSSLQAIPWGQTLSEAAKAPDRSAKAYFGLFPFRWQADWQRSFEALRGHGRPLIAPILQLLILDQDPTAVAAWVDRICAWEFDQMIAAHFEAPVKTSALEVRQAFAALQSSADAPVFGSQYQPMLSADVGFMQRLEKSLDQRGLTKARR
jgi:Domain of unknown function (DUF4336)